MKGYYRICLRHMGKKDNCFLFWGKDSSGYYRSIEDAGIYDESDNSEDDPLVSCKIIEKYKQKIVLPQYGETKEKYADRNEFYVLPNTGQVRELLGITTLDIKLEGNRNSFNCSFKNEIIEKFKFKYSDTNFIIKGKETCFTEFWYYNESFKAENKNKAITQAYKQWDMRYKGMTYLEFKSMITCSKDKELILDKWRKIK